ncbi:MAG: hypothetical protein ACREPD_08035 [Stenotrophomonas sp.]|uniref:hypothetical protein n=1 Tax=Stenotrophomonas sp. TaxID=69392 RepID=UPI003D6D713B
MEVKRSFEMKPRLECPHCKKLFPDQWIWEQQFNCAHCRAPLRFCWPLRIAAYATTALVTIFLFRLLRPFWVPLAVFSSPGHIDRGSLTNFAIFAPQFLPGFLLGKAILHRFGSLTLINPNWPLRLSVADRKLMRELDISTNGEYFTFDGLDFDSLRQAVDYARANGRHVQK